MSLGEMQGKYMARLPEPNASLGITLTYFSVLRELHGTKFCRQKVIGPLRHRLDTMGERIPVEVLSKASGGVSFKEATEEASAVLAFHCAICGRCKLAL